MIEAQPTEKVYGIPPEKGFGKSNLIVVTHGWQPNILDSGLRSPNIQVFIDMTNDINNYLIGNNLTNWQVNFYSWIPNAWVGLPDTALANATQEGINLGDAIANEGWAHVHFIGHSAGSSLIQMATTIVKTYSPSTTVQCTFLDPYLGLDLEFEDVYGQTADWSDSYAANGDIENAVEPFTDEPLSHAYNVDVTDLDPNLNKYPLLDEDGTPICYTYGSTHGWPVNFYTNSIPPNAPSDYDGFGFQLSVEGGYWAKATNEYHVGNVSSVHNLGAAPPVCPGLPVNMSLSVTALNPSGLQIPWQYGSPTIGNNYLTLPADAPSWISFITPHTNAVNVLDFDADFTSTSGAAGLLTVYWDANVIGAVDERLVGQGIQHYRMQFPLAPSFTTHIIGFRLDDFTINITSVVTLTNMVLSASGVTEPFSLSPTTNIANGSPEFRLSGPAGFDYGLQASTDCFNWTQIAILENINGKVNFHDQNMTNYPVCRFYRAVAPY